MMILVAHKKSLVSLIGFCFVLAILPVASATSQESNQALEQAYDEAINETQDADTDTEFKDEASKERQTKLVRGIYDATKTAKTVKDYTAFLAQCESALEENLSSENQDYVISLTGWALNRRGLKHFELASQLKKIGNNRYKSAMKQAMDDFDQAISSDSERYRSWMSRGIAHNANGDFEKAVLDFTTVTKLKADEVNGWFNRAESLFQLGKFEESVRHYTTVIRLNSDDAQALTGRGHALLELGRFDEALADYERVIQLHPAVDNAFVNRGDIHQRLGNWQLAQDDYDKAISLKETGISLQRSAWLKATCPDESIRNAAEAKKLIERSIALLGKTPKNLDTLAAVEAANGDFESAKLNQEKVIGLVNAEIDVQKDSDPKNEPDTETKPDANVSQYKARLMLYEQSKPYLQEATNDLVEPEPGK